MVIKTPIDPTYTKDNGLWTLRTDLLTLPKDFEAREKGLVYIPSGQIGGNHKHPRREVFIGVGDELYIAWRDDTGHTHEEKMMDGKQLYMFDVEPLTPHAVINRGVSFGVLLEFATGPNVGVEPVDVLKP